MKRKQTVPSQTPIMPGTPEMAALIRAACRARNKS